VHTQFGYHIIRLDDIQTPHVRTFEEARGELEPEFRKEQAQNAFYDKSQQLADESFAALSELDSVAKKLGLPLHTVDVFTRQGGGDLGSDRKLIDAAFSEPVLQERQNSPPVQVGEDSVVVLRVTDYRPSRERPLAEVRDEIVQRLTVDAEREAAVRAAKELAQRVNAGEPFPTVAASANLQPTAVQTVTRLGPANQTDLSAPPIAPEMLKAIFQAPHPAAGGKVAAGSATLASGDQVVFVISAVHPGNVPQQLAAQPDLAQRISQQSAVSEVESYTSDLQRTAKIKKNEKIFATECRGKWLVDSGWWLVRKPRDGALFVRRADLSEATRMRR
jgi:peptidyl-prolyl cis-trans isomerase D